jgi:hypothetical protein
VVPVLAGFPEAVVEDAVPAAVLVPDTAASVELITDEVSGTETVVVPSSTVKYEACQEVSPQTSHHWRSHTATMGPNPLSLNERPKYIRCKSRFRERNVSNLDICIEVKEADPSRCGKVSRGREARRLCIQDDHITAEDRYA